MPDNKLLCFENIAEMESLILSNRRKVFGFFLGVFMPILLLAGFNGISGLWGHEEYFNSAAFIAFFSFLVLWLFFSPCDPDSIRPLTKSLQEQFRDHVSNCAEYPEVVQFVRDIDAQNRRPVVGEYNRLSSFSCRVKQEKEIESEKKDADDLWRNTVAIAKKHNNGVAS